MNPFIEILRQPFTLLFKTVIGFLPNLIIALVLVALGFIIGTVFEKVIAYVVRALKVNELLDRTEVKKFFSRAGLRLDAGLFLGGLVKWFIVIAFLMAGLQAVGLTQVNAFLTAVVLNYIPQVIIATLMLLVAAVASRAVKTAITSSTKAFGVSTADFLGGIASSAIWVGTFIFVLSQLGIAADLMKILFIGIVAMFSLAFGLAFGLGGKEEAAILLAKMRKDASNHS
jgi:hypothetical protein